MFGLQDLGRSPCLLLAEVSPAHRNTCRLLRPVSSEGRLLPGLAFEGGRGRQGGGEGEAGGRETVSPRTEGGKGGREDSKGPASGSF